MVETYITGRECKLVHNTASFATPTWDEVLNCETTSGNRDGGEVVFDNRGIANKQSKRESLKHAIECTFTWSRGTNADYEAFRDALLNETLIDCWHLDGASATAGHQGDRFEFAVLSESIDMPLADGVKVTFTLAPGVSSETPQGNLVAV